MEIDISMCSFCLKIRGFKSISRRLGYACDTNSPREPSLSRGCSAGTARPRRSSGMAGRWKLSAGRAKERKARGAVRERNEAMLILLEAELSLLMAFGESEISNVKETFTSNRFVIWRHCHSETSRSDLGLSRGCIEVQRAS